MPTKVPPGRRLRQTRFLSHPGCHPLLQAKLNLLAGPLESNKSTYAAMRAALHTQMGGRVGILSSEDEWEEDAGPRLAAAGAVLDRCLFTDRAYMFPGSTEAVIKWAKSHKIDLLIIDMANDFAGRAVRMRDAYMPLKKACYRAGITIMLLLHTNKGLRKGQAAIDAIPGPRRDIQGLVKLALVIAKSQDDPTGVRHVGVAKFNRGEHPPSLSYAVLSDDLVPDGGYITEYISDMVSLKPIGPSALSAEEILEQAARIGETDDDDAPMRSEAARLLGEMLKDGRMHKVSEIRKVTDEAGISWPTVKRARMMMGIEHSREGNEHSWHAPTGLLAELRRGDDPDAPEPDSDWTIPDD
jgi:AAA domain